MDEQVPAAAFPTPPPFYKHFTKDNVSRLRQLRKEAESTGATDSEKAREIDILALPSELRYLIPPEPPADGKFMSFGVETSLDALDPTLADTQVDQLYSDDPAVRLNPQSHLIAFSRSLLTSFLSLAGILAQNPELHVEKVKELRTITLNMHDLINQYRPHQARETLILEMENRVSQMKEEISDIDKQKEKVSKLLQDLQNYGTAQALQEEMTKKGTRVGQDTAEETRRNKQKAKWAALEQEIG